MGFDFDISHENMSVILDWKLQYENVKPLLVVGGSETTRADLMSKFGQNYFEYTVFTNLKNNEEICDYMNEHEPGRDMIFFLEKSLSDMIVPTETILILNNAHSCDGIWPLLKYVHDSNSDIFIAATGEFTEEQIAAAAEYTMLLRL